MSIRTVTLDLFDAVRAYREAITTLESLARMDVLTSADAMRIAAGLELGPARAGLAKLEDAILAVNALEERLGRSGRALESIAQAATKTIHDLRRTTKEPNE